MAEAIGGDETHGGLLLDVVVGESAAVFELLAGEDQSLLVWWDTLLVLNIGLKAVSTYVPITAVSQGEVQGGRLRRLRNGIRRIGPVEDPRAD
jgi:hypothetical protein